MIEYDDWADVPGDQWLWPNFTPEEMACNGSRSLRIDPMFMDKLQALRVSLGFPLSVSSGYRSESYDKVIGGAGVHPQGCAADIRIAGEQAFYCVAAAVPLFTGIGVSQKGEWRHRFIHLDTLPNGDHPRPRLWSY